MRHELVTSVARNEVVVAAGWRMTAARVSVRFIAAHVDALPSTTSRFSAYLRQKQSYRMPDGVFPVLRASTVVR